MIKKKKMETATLPKKSIHHSNKPALLLMVLLVVLLFAFMLADIMLGSVRVPAIEVIRIIAGKDTKNEAWNNIITLIRIPKAFTAMLAGCALSVAGLQMQTLFRNPLAGPSVLGITSGASLGVALVMLSSGMATSMYTIRSLGIPQGWLMVLAAVAGAIMVLLLIIMIATRIRDNVVLLIVGIMVGNITLAIVSIWQYYSNPQQIQDFLIWTFGSLGGVTRQHLVVLAVTVLAGLVLTIFSAKALNAWLLGEGYAKSMGLDILKSRIFIISATGLLAGGVTAFCGPIGFVGIAVPHLSRALFGTSDHKILIPATCLIGSILMLFCDIMAQLPGSDQSLPINAVTALLGSPVVIWVILRQNQLRMSFS